jgi:hypothetical protein
VLADPPQVLSARLSCCQCRGTDRGLATPIVDRRRRTNRGRSLSSSLSCRRSSRCMTVAAPLSPGAASVRHTVPSTVSGLGKRIQFTPSRVRIPHPPPVVSRRKRGPDPIGPRHSWPWRRLLHLFLIPYHVTAESLVGEQRPDRNTEYHEVVDRVPEFWPDRDGDSTKLEHLRKGRKVRGRS